MYMHRNTDKKIECNATNASNSNAHLGNGVPNHWRTRRGLVRMVKLVFRFYYLVVLWFKA